MWIRHQSGALFGAGGAPCTGGQLNPVLIQVPVYEAEINDIKVGDEAVIEIPSLNNRKFTGLVNEISWLSTDMNVANPSYYNVELTVPNPDLILKPGFKAVVRFEASGKSQMKLKSIPAKLGYIVGAQWTRILHGRLLPYFWPGKTRMRSGKLSWPLLFGYLVKPQPM